jgi:hypothetical protein
MSDYLTSRAQRLIDEFEEGESIRHGIARVLTHLAYAFDMICDGDGESMVGVPVSTLDALAAELTAPSLLDRALAGDRAAARQFLHEAGFTDANGQLLPHYRSEDLNDD